MSRFQQRLAPLTLMVLLALSGGVHAAGKQHTKPQIIQPTRSSPYTEEEQKAETQRRDAIVVRTQNLFTLLSAEMANNNGDVANSLGLYLNTFRTTRDPEVGERAMEIAINARAYNVAEAAYQMWREIEPTPSSAQRRLAWVRALALGEHENVFHNLPDVLANADENQRRRAFLMLSHMSLTRPDLVKNGAKVVQDAAKQYEDLPEAAMAEVFYSEGKKSRIVNALQRLAKLDADILPATELTLSWVANQHPQALKLFFDKTDTEKLSPAWLEVEVENLINQAKYDEAAEKLSHLLGNEPRANLYFQAARLSTSRSESVDTIVGYFEKAYQVGTQEEKASAAMAAAAALVQKGRWDEAATWAAKIDAPKYAFDKATFQASIAAEQEDWQKAREFANIALKQPENSGIIFEQRDATRIYLYAVLKSSTPQQALVEMNHQLAKAERDKANPNYADSVSEILYQRGLLYADKLNQPEKAVADLRRYLILNPNSAAAHNALGYTLLSIKGKLDEAFGLLQTAHKLSPDNAQIKDSLGWAYVQKGDVATALPYLEQAYADEHDAEVAAHLGEAYWRMGEQEKAKTVWREAWRDNPTHQVLMETLKRFEVVF